ncbi:hypothetical protein V5N11_034562 [Cardamine amara subsp. amara]|uniref:C3H1-type domain-containing protein n=1 Tax=Cardamine amara subsp. amara TaxID=228776 RepID=A0ABD0ZVU1_CARAN
MFLLVLYIFLPSLLFFLIYSSPVLACALVYAREKLGLRFSSSYNSFSSLEPKSCEDEKRCHLKQQRSVRRNARMKVEEWDSQTSEEEKDKVILTSLYNDLLGRTTQFEESPKAIEETNIVEDNDKFLGEEDTRELDNLNVERPTTDCNCEIKYRDLDGKDEETKEEMGNVNEHGISEIERNRRLESLIARRRARRLFRLALDQRSKLQAEETTSPKQNNNNNLQITVTRSNNLEKRRSYPSETNAMGIQIPGSAPSVLLQGRNPFDIPYDPQEERPILTGDSFDQEFSLFNHKDMFFCRHESFCRFAHFSPEHAQCLNSPVPASEISSTRKRLDLDNEYMDQKLPCNEKEATIEDDDKSVESEKCKEREVEMNEETDSNKEESDDDSSYSEESESELNRLNKAELREAICQSMDNNYSGFQMNQTRNSIPNTLPRGLVAPRLDDNNMFYNRRCGNSSHSRTFSVASDMQVEVSEIGSPPTTVDWLDDWSNGGESYTYDTDIDREIIRGEESRKKIFQQYDESRSGMESKEVNNRPKSEHEAKSDENILADDMSLSDRRGESEEIFEQNTSSSSDVSKPTKGLLFRTSVSLSSITEEPETILDSFDGGNSENINFLDDELTDQKPLTTLDSSMKKLIDEEVVDVQNLENNGSPKVIDLSIIDHQPKDQILSNIQGEDDTEINMKKSEDIEPREYEETQSLLDASLDTPYIESFEREVKEEEDVSNLENFTEEITKQTENEEHQSDLKSSQDQVLTEVLESEVVEENGQELVKNTDEKTEPIEQETPHNVLKASLIDPHVQLSEDYKNAENKSDVILIQVLDDHNSTIDESTDQEISKEGENSGLLKDSYDESTQENKNRVNVEEESIVSTDIQNSQGSQPWTQQCDINSSEGISPKTLEITQQVEHEDAISPNTVSDKNIHKDEVIAVAKDSAASENNNEENDLKLCKQVGEAVEKELEFNLESMHHNIGLHVRGDDEESKQVIRAMQDGETQTTNDENRVLEN